MTEQVHGSPAGQVRRGLRAMARQMARLAVRIGLPPATGGWRHVRREAPAAYLQRQGQDLRVDLVHPEIVAANPLPRNVKTRDLLSPDRGWFGFSFRDVPERAGGATRILRVGPARVVCYGGPGQPEEFHPAIVSRDGTALELDQIIFRPGHARVLRAGLRPQRLARAIWILERVYHNHSHWLTAHLPKVVLLRERGMLDDMVLPRRRTRTMDASLRLLGVDPDACPAVDTDRPLDLDELILIETDRFRPELLRPVRAALVGAVCRKGSPAVPRRRVFITREGARGRQLLGEADLRPDLEARGFEIVRMEDLDFPDQVRLMAETAVLLAPHGAGLTNMMFCAEGAQVAEIADPGYPNPNFYALASAMGLGYWVVPAEGVGEGHPLARDLRADPAAVLTVVDAMIAEGPRDSALAEADVARRPRGNEE